MKKLYVQLAVLVAVFRVSAQDGTTFDVRNNDPSLPVLMGGKEYFPFLKELIAEDFRPKVVPLLMVGQSKAPQNIGFGYVHSTEQLNNAKYGGTFNEVFFASAHRYPIVFTPESVWLLVSQGFSRHLLANPEKAKEWFGEDPHGVFTVTAPEGFGLGESLPEPHTNYLLWTEETRSQYKRRSSEGLYTEVWENDIFPQLKGQMVERFGAELAGMLTNPFSTTTLTDQAAFYAPYGQRNVYHFPNAGITVVQTGAAKSGNSGCYIPQVTLVGNTNDWSDIFERAKALAKYDLEWWIDELVPVLEQFVEASWGRVDTEFWKDMLVARSMPGGYRDEFVYDGIDGKKVLIYSTGPWDNHILYTGWILKFYPYNNRNQRNSMKAMPLPGTVDGLPLETFTADMRFVDQVRADTTMLELWAGNMGFGVPEGMDDVKTTLQYSVAPYIGWMVRKKDDRISVLRDYFVRGQRSEDFKLEFSFDGTIPEPIRQMPSIEQLDIYLDTMVRLLPAGLEKIPIKRIVLHEKIEGVGELDEANLEELRRKLPDTDVSMGYEEPKGKRYD